jgi:2-iminoacetate synthase
MTVDFLPSLSSFADWIRNTDDHAVHHLALLERADHALRTPDKIAPNERRSLTQKLERWRYQHLNEHAGQLSARDESFVDALDLVANDLAGRPDRAPRWTRRAINDASFDTDAIQQAANAIDSRYPLDQVVARATELTWERFRPPNKSGFVDHERQRVLLYAPLYVSSECINHCRYCGFRYPQDIARKHLSVEEAAAQMRILRDRGFRHLLIVGGDFPSRTTTEFYAEILRALAQEGIEPAIEIAPRSTQSYAELVDSGARGLTLYQETYNQELYARYHVGGPKSSYHWRLESHDRAAEAGMPRLGLGILLGLADARDDLMAMMRHAAYLKDRFPDRTLAFSLPRIHEAPGEFEIPYPVSDDQLIRLYSVLRLAFPEAELVLSTREPVELRNRLAKICITQLSAGSSTAPGGYQASGEAVGEQFPVIDNRSSSDVANWLEAEGFRICWSIEQANTKPAAARPG